MTTTTVTGMLEDVGWKDLAEHKRYLHLVHSSSEEFMVVWQYVPITF